MTYLDNGATSMNKPQAVWEAMRCAMENCANPGRSGHTAAMTAARKRSGTSSREIRCFSQKQSGNREERA